MCDSRFSRFASYTLLVAVQLCLAVEVAKAQEFAVYTTVRSASDGTPTGPVLARSNTIFHAGKSYDYMEEVGEVVICDPIQRRFTILHQGRVGTRLEFDELAQYVNVGRTETASYAEELSLQPDGKQVAEALVFQLLPDFETSVTPVGFEMNASHWHYAVESTKPEIEQQATRYADYADAAAKLNFVLHPQSFYPAVREALNAELRENRTVPTQVSLRANVGDVVELLAEHKYRWSLTDYDRRQIRKFDQLTDATSVNWIGFREYQRQVLGH